MRLRIGWGPFAAEMRVDRSERELLHPLLVVLSDKRALLHPAAGRMDADEVVRSIEDVRANLTFALKELGPDATVAGELEILRRSCRDYLHAFDGGHRDGSTDDSVAALRELQSSFREVIAGIAATYDLTAARELVREMEQRSLPSSPESAAGMRDKGPGETRSSDGDVLWSTDQLAELEQALEVRTIWIIGRDFATDMPDMPFYAAIRHNILRRGIKYAYVALDTSTTRRQLKTLRTTLELPDPSRLAVFLLSAERWSELPYTAGNVSIYDPLSRDRPPLGYFWYPGGNGEVFGRLGDYVVIDWVKTMLEICPPLELTVHE